MIDVNEYMMLIYRLANIQLSREDALGIFAVIDADGNGTISKSEFADFYAANY